MTTYLKPLPVLVALFALSCAAPPEPMEEAPPVDLVAEKAAVAVVVDQFAEVWANEDMNLLSQIFSHGPDLFRFGTDEAEVWVGYEALAASLETQFAAYEDTEVTSEDQRVTVHSSGEVAWFSEIANWHVTAEGERFENDGMHVTGVLEKRDGNWVFVQINVSVPDDGQVVAY